MNVCRLIEQGGTLASGTVSGLGQHQRTCFVLETPTLLPVFGVLDSYH
ncbi:MAG: hypothetical protein IPN98_10490 [Propionivibrio sp.]|nr:hypothetical protein [Propionivibrio sp.]